MWDPLKTWARKSDIYGTGVFNHSGLEGHVTHSGKGRRGRIKTDFCIYT